MSAWVIGSGSGPWLVVCHGMALDHRDLLPIAEEAAAQGWRALVWDMPGHGRAGPTTDWSISGMTDALEKLLDQHGVDRAVLLGFSFGGVVAQELLRRRPSAVSALIAYACFAPRATGPLGPAWIANLLFGWRRWPAIQRTFAQGCAVTQSARAAVVEASGPVGKRGFIAMSQALMAELPRDPAFGIDRPLLLLAGGRDNNGRALARAQDALATLSTDVTRHIVPDAGHCAHLDNPEAVKKAVLTFLDGLTRSDVVKSPER